MGTALSKYFSLNTSALAKELKSKMGEEAILNWTFTIENYNDFLDFRIMVVTKDGNVLKEHLNARISNQPYNDLPDDTAWSRLLLKIQVRSDNDYGMYRLEGNSQPIHLTPG